MFNPAAKKKPHIFGTTAKTNNLKSIPVQRQKVRPQISVSPNWEERTIKRILSQDQIEALQTANHAELIDKYLSINIALPESVQQAVGSNKVSVLLSFEVQEGKIVPKFSIT